MPLGIRHMSEDLHGAEDHILREGLWIGLESDRKTKGSVDFTLLQVDQKSPLGHLGYRTIINEHTVVRCSEGTYKVHEEVARCWYWEE